MPMHRVATALLAVACALLFAAAATARPDPDPPPPSGAHRLWAVLIAGSAGWANYRHQADVLHAYAALIARGVPADHIITLLADDVPDHELNPFPGEVRNAPNGRDLRAGVAVDYTGADVSTSTFLAVLRGDAAGVAALTSANSTRRVLDSLTRSDRLLVFYSDHGGPGLLGMPSGPPLFGDQFVGALRSVHASEVVVVVEACDAGSSFEGLVPKNDDASTAPRLWVVTASAPGEPSWATFCSQREFGTCLGDAFTVAWLADVEGLGGGGRGGKEKKDTLEAQFGRVRAAVAPRKGGGGGRSGGRGGGSHVSQYGPRSLARTTPATALEGPRPASVPVPLSGGLLGRPQVPQWEAGGGGRGGGAGRASTASAALEAALGGLTAGARPPGSPVVDDWACYRRLADAWAGAGCGGGLAGTAAGWQAGSGTHPTRLPPLTTDQSGLRYAGALARACNAGVSEAEVGRVLVQACGGGGVTVAAAA